MRYGLIFLKRQPLKRKSARRGGEPRPGAITLAEVIVMHSPTHSKPLSGDEPSYRSFRHLPERERWQWYANAKRIRHGQEAAGVRMTETYDQFIARVTRELEL